MVCVGPWRCAGFGQETDTGRNWPGDQQEQPGTSQQGPWREGETTHPGQPTSSLHNTPVQ